MAQGAQENTTKQRILECAAALFAEKGFTETSIRELANAVGVKNPASLYFHFPSKNAILDHMLEDYREYNADMYQQKDIPGTLRRDPTTDGIMACFHTVFPDNRVEYYLNVLCVLLQEQLRNPIVKKYMSDVVILGAERNTKSVVEALKDLGIISRDTDCDYWMKVISSLFYSFAARMMLGIGDNDPEFTGMGMLDIMRYTFDLMLKVCGAEKSEDGGSGEG